MIRILFQGDSITDGNRYKDPESRWDLNHQIGHSYVFTVVGTLGRRYPGKFTFINRGLSGDSVATITQRWQRDALDERPDLLSLLLGINGNGQFDGVFEEGADEHLRQFEEGYRRLLQTAREENPSLMILLMEPFALPVGHLKPHYQEFLSIFCQKQRIVRELAKEFDAVFVPIQETLEAMVAKTAPVLEAEGNPCDPMSYWLWDGIHPTETMHSLLSEMWLEGFSQFSLV